MKQQLEPYLHAVAGPVDLLLRASLWLRVEEVQLVRSVTSTYDEFLQG